ncbi:hypothetical protein CIG19_17035 [Enterobacterales bacterium CwR94]|nr:hypothetical protein CIG19_17035 [Enterobacterales bacterium CwR94]
MRARFLQERGNSRLSDDKEIAMLRMVIASALILFSIIFLLGLNMSASLKLKMNNVTQPVPGLCTACPRL